MSATPTNPTNPIYLIGFDVGGSGGRCLLVDAGTGAAWSASRSWTHPAVPGTGGTGADLDLPALWRKLGEATREVLARAGAEPGQVAGVAASAMRFASVVLDGQGGVIQAAPNRDARAAAEAFALALEHGEALAAATGHWPAPVMAGARLLHLAKHDPAGSARAAHLLSLNDWLTWRLCGLVASEPSQAGGTGLFDLHARDWAWDWVERLGLRRALFPELRRAGERAGELGAEAAAALGLRAGTPVAVGGADSQCGLLGAGALLPGALCAVAGTTTPVMRVCERPPHDAKARLWIGHHVVDGLWVAESNAGPAGEALAWAGRILAPDAPEPAARLLAEASRAPVGACGYRSTFGAQIGDARALSLPVGDLTLCHLAGDGEQGRAAFARAIVEGMACALRGNVEQLVEIAGGEARLLHLAGGMSRSAVWSQIVADVLGVPVRVGREPDATALGAALCAGVGAGVFASLDAAAGALAAARETREPEPEAAKLYQGVYESWRALRAAREPAAGLAVAAALPGMLAHAARSGAVKTMAERPRMLVTASLDDESLERLRALGPVEYAPFRERMRLLTGDALVSALAGVQVFVTEVDVVDARSMAALPELRVVASCRGDAVNVDVEAATALGIPVLNAPGRNADAVADLTVAYLLVLARKLVAANQFLRDPAVGAGDMGKLGQAFQALRGRELWRKTVGLVGLGAVGRGVARRLAGFGVRVLVFDPFLPPEQVVLAGAEPATLDALLAESDFVSLHAPVTPETEGLIGVRELARMKPGACLVNSARAALVDEEALVAALARGHLGGVATDVFPLEPPGHDHPLLAFDNVVATPHVGGNTVEVAAHQGRIIAEDLALLLAGERPRHALNPAATEGFALSRARPVLDEARLAALAARPAPAVTDLQKKPARKAARSAVAPAAPAPAVARPAQAAPPAAVVEAMGRVVRAFTEGIAADRALRGFAAGKDVTLHFELSDLPIEFHFRLRGGAVTAGPGAPEEDAEVSLRMRADVLDGMFTGRVNPMQSALSGGLSFSGDAAKAMTLQQIQADLSRLYRAARERAGAPGDLAALPDPEAPAGEPALVAPPGEADVRHALVAAVEELYRAELVTATGGNVSARVPGREHEIWITPSQLFKGDLRPETLVRIDLDGKRLEGRLSPSSEWMMHCAIYRAKPEANAVVHAHAPHATILANADLPFLPVSTEAAFFGDIPRVPFIMPGTRELADAIGRAVGDGWAVLMKNHGLLVGGRTLRRAADMVEIIDRSAQVMLGCWAVGKEPPSLPPEAVKTLRAMGDLVA